MPKPEKAKPESDPQEGMVISLKVTPQVFAALKHLNKTGLYGFTLEDTVNRLVCEKIVEKFRIVR